MPVTIKDIARAAGVSHTTVSRALKDNPAISAETRARIQQLAGEMGYTPSAVAQSLLSSRTQTIGMVITTIADPFVAEVVEGVESVAQAANYSVFLTTSHNNPDQEIAVVETLHRRRVDAIIVTSSRVGSLYRSRLDQIKIPVVLINNQEEGEFFHSVSANDIQGAQLAVEHLIRLGHRNIGYIGAPNRPRSNRRRQSGYQKALTQAGIHFDPKWVLQLQVEADFERGRAGVELFLNSGITATFCYNDIIAIGLLMACQQKGIRVPNQLSIIGFDNITATQYVTPPLTSVYQPRLQMGKTAMQMTLALLNNKDVQDHILPCKLIIRKSTAQVYAT